MGLMQNFLCILAVCQDSLVNRYLQEETAPDVVVTTTQNPATEQQENVSTASITQLVFTVNAVRMEHGGMLLNSNVKVACP